MDDDTALDRIGRLAAIARGLEREGAYNGAKLVRGALERELIRYAERAAPVGVDAAGDATEVLARELAEDGYPAAFVERLSASVAALRTGGPIPLRDAPPVRTCRVCGELFLGDDVPVACPTCEAPAISFREHIPVWYLEHAEPGTILAELATGPRRVRLAMAGRSDDDLAVSPAVGEWSARETLEHLVYAEGLLAVRVPRLLDEDDPDLVAWFVGAGAPTTDEGTAATGKPASVLFEQYRAKREATVARLRDLEDGAWGRAGRHPEWGRVTVLSQAAYFARHEASHLAQLVAAAEGRLPGARGATVGG
jgi:hypothetical protein